MDNEPTHIAVRASPRQVIGIFVIAMTFVVVVLIALVVLTVSVELRVENTAQRAVDLSRQNSSLLHEIQATQKVSVGSRDILCTLIALSDVKGNRNEALAAELLKRDCPSHT